MVKRRDTRPGFALLEAIVASVLLGLALAAILSLAGQAISAQRRGEVMETAARLADERLNLVLAVGPERYPSIFRSSGVCDPPFEGYFFAVEIAPGASGEAYEVRASVTAAPTVVTLETRIAPRLGDDPDPDRKPQQTVETNAR